MSTTPIKIAVKFYYTGPSGRRYRTIQSMLRREKLSPEFIREVNKLMVKYKCQSSLKKS